MPFMKKDPKTGKMVRDYKRENLLYNSKPEQRKNRSERTIARNAANADGRMSPHDGKDLDHIVPLSKGGSNNKSNTRVATQAANRSFSRNPNGSLKSQRSKKGI
jgi:hypothetical protein